MRYELITCIIERDKADRVVDAALEAGAQAATTFYARGRGVRERIGLFGRFIQPEKEVIFIVTRTEQTDAVFNAAVKAGQLDEPGKGFAFVQPVERAVGFIQ